MIAAANYHVLEMKINPLEHEQVLHQMDIWVKDQVRGRYVMVANTHSVMECHNNPDYEKIAQEADLIIPDGMPLVVIGRYRGFRLKQRADGPGLMLKAMRISAEKGWRHYFYGGTPETLALLLKRLRASWPDVQIAGSYSPPFRPLRNEEDENTVTLINNSHADVLWVGLGCPKQEKWMWEHQKKLNVPVMVGVGQAFDLFAGVKKRAPTWMCNLGLEWLYRLISEPRRVWKRYIINNPWFVCLFLMEEIRLRIRKIV